MKEKVSGGGGKKSGNRGSLGYCPCRKKMGGRERDGEDKLGCT